MNRGVSVYEVKETPNFWTSDPSGPLYPNGHKGACMLYIYAGFFNQFIQKDVGDRAASRKASSLKIQHWYFPDLRQYVIIHSMLYGYSLSSFPVASNILQRTPRFCERLPLFSDYFNLLSSGIMHFAFFNVLPIYCYLPIKASTGIYTLRWQKSSVFSISSPITPMTRLTLVVTFPALH